MMSNKPLRYDKELIERISRTMGMSTDMVKLQVRELLRGLLRR